MAAQPTYLTFEQQTINDPEFKELPALARRIAHLLGSQPKPKRSWQACLDDLLGAVYSLMYAKHFEYRDRPQPLAADDIDAVHVRASDMSTMKVRTNGQWTAGFYFNNTLFRIAAVFHRTLKIVTGKEQQRRQVYVDDLLPQAEKMFAASQSRQWTNANLTKIHKEVNDLKHTPGGVHSGRDVRFSQALLALNEILTLIEAFVN